MNIHHADDLNALAGAMNLSPEQLRAHLMNLGHAMLVQGIQNSNLPGTAGSYAAQLRRQIGMLEKAADDTGVPSGFVPSTWLIDHRTVVLGVTGLTTTIL